MKNIDDGYMERWTDEQICNARYQMSEMMLEKNVNTGKVTEDAKAAMVAFDALNLALKYKRT